MFTNCRKYNEENSMIYKDALNLERILMEKVKELGPLPPPDAPLITKPIEKKPPKRYHCERYLLNFRPQCSLNKFYDYR